MSFRSLFHFWRIRFSSFNSLPFFWFASSFFQVFYLHLVLFHSFVWFVLFVIVSLLPSFSSIQKYVLFIRHAMSFGFDYSQNYFDACYFAGHFVKQGVCVCVRVYCVSLYFGFSCNWCQFIKWGVTSYYWHKYDYNPFRLWRNNYMWLRLTVVNEVEFSSTCHIVTGAFQNAI